MSTPPTSQFHRIEALSLAAGLTVLAIALPYSHVMRAIYYKHVHGHSWLTEARFSDLVVITMGLILTLPDPKGSGLAQDLFFGGVIYRILRPHFSTRVVSWLPFEWALPVGGLFFAAWHLQNLDSFPLEYVIFQLLYTWAAYTFVGLTRQWTGSLLYITAAHMAGNFIVWYVDTYNVKTLI